MLDTRKIPMVRTSTPNRNETDIDTSLSSISLEFNTDLKQATYAKDGNRIDLASFFTLRDSDNQVVETSFTYRTRVIEILIVGTLRLGEKYTLWINEGTAGQSSIQSVEGIEMPHGEKISFFTTKNYLIKPPEVITPMNRARLESPFEFEWKNANIPDTYEVQIATDKEMTQRINNEMDRFVTEGNGEGPNSSYQADPSILPAGQYYWRIASWFNKGGLEEQRSAWSEVYTFYVEDKLSEGTVAPEDAPTWEPSEEEDSFYIEYVGSFPEDGNTNMKTTLRVIYFKVIGVFDPSEIEFSLTGESSEGEDNDHGELPYRMEITEENGYQLVAFILDDVIQD